MTTEAIKYVKDMLELGYGLSDIKAELEKKGWSKKHIESIIRKATSEKEKEDKKSLSKYDAFILFLGMVLTIIFMVWVSASANASFSTVFFCFLPIIMTLITIYLIMKRVGQKYLLFMLLVPLCWSGLVYVMATNTDMFQKVDISNIVLLDILISLGIITVMYLIQKSVKLLK